MNSLKVLNVLLERPVYSDGLAFVMHSHLCMQDLEPWYVTVGKKVFVV